MASSTLQLSPVIIAPTAENLLELLLKALEDASGLPREKLCEKLVGCSTDGASVNTGAQGGLITLLRRRYAPKLQVRK